jgi:hypothetical protein
MLVSANHTPFPWVEGENAPVHSSSGLGNSAGVGVRHSQKLHLYSSAVNGRRNAKGCQGAPILGLEYRKEEGVGAEDGIMTVPD